MLRLIVTAVENSVAWGAESVSRQIGSRATPAVDTCEDTCGFLHIFVPLLTLVLFCETNVFLAGLASLHGETDDVTGKADQQQKCLGRVGSTPSSCLRRLGFQSRHKDRIH